jgi:hypothetical protein
MPPMKASAHDHNEGTGGDNGIGGLDDIGGQVSARGH